MIETKITGRDIESPFTLPSGVNLLTSVSGGSNIGTSGIPFGTIYVNNIVSTGITSGDFVHITGDTMTGNLKMSNSNILIGNAVPSGATSLIIGGGAGVYGGPSSYDNLVVGGNASVYRSNSAAIGYYSIASGSSAQAFAIGSNAKALENDAMAFGNSAEAYGYSSVSIGQTAKSRQQSDIAIGDGSEASGTYSLALGYQAKTYASYSTALGYVSKAKQNYATAIGISSLSSGNSSVAISTSNTNALADYSVAIGYQANTEVGANYSAVLGGYNNYTYGQYSTTIGGDNNKASGNYSIAAGAASDAIGANSLAIGSHAKANAQGTFVLSDSQGANANGNNPDTMYLRFQSGVTLMSGTNLYPETSGIQNIGSTSNPFSGIYSKTIYADSINDVPVYTTAYFVRPSGDIDGSNDTFTLANTPIDGLVFVFENGIRLTPSGSHGYDFDYYITGSSIIFSSPPPSGSKILVDYTY